MFTEKINKTTERVDKETILTKEVVQEIVDALPKEFPLHFLIEKFYCHIEQENLPPKERLKAEIREAVEELKLIRAGKLEARNARDVINEL